MAHRGMKKLRQVEKIGLVGLCVLMLAMLGLSGSAMQGCQPVPKQGSFKIDGEEIVIDNSDFLDYRGFQLFQNRVTPLRYQLTSVYGISLPPPWKFLGPGDSEFRNYQASEKDLWTFIVLDHVAERAGIEIAPENVKDYIESFYGFQEDGDFSKRRYDDFLSKVAGTWATASEFEKFVGRFLRVQYLLTNYDPLTRPTHRQIYEDWKNRNQRHDFDYVVQPLAPLREEIDPAGFAESEVQTFYAKDEVRRSFRIPTQWSFEADYLIPADLTKEQFAELRKKAEDAGLVTMTVDEARQYYYANPKIYDVEAVRRRLKAAWEEEQAEKKAAGESGKTTEPGDGEKTTEPGDGEKTTEPGADEDREGEPDSPAADDEDPPAAGEDGAPAAGEDGEQPAAGEDGEQPAAGADEAPAAGEDGEQPAAGADEAPAADEEEAVWKDPLESMEPAKIYATYFQERVERDLFTKRLLERLLKDERIRREGLDRVAEAWGLVYDRTDAPMDGNEIVTNRPVGGVELRSHLLNFEGGDGGKYSEEVVRIGGTEPAKTGWCFFRVLEVIPDHFPELGDTMPKKRLIDAVRNSNPRVEPFGSPEIEASALLVDAYGSVVEKKESYTVDDVVRLMLRDSKAIDRAKEKLTALKESVLSGNQSFEPAAKELGYEMRAVRGATEESVVPSPDRAPAGEELTAVQREHNRLLAQRTFLLKSGMPSKLKNLKRISQTRTDSFLDEVLTDGRTTDSAYLVYVRSHRMPGPEEMPESEAQQIAQKLGSSRLRPTLKDFFSFEKLKKRYDIRVKGMGDGEQD